MKKSLELERLVFFSDAIVAIAITLLALELKIETTSANLNWNDFGPAAEKFVSFFLSFFTIALFWKIHHEFFAHVRNIDDRLLLYNILWLLFIVLIPFSTSLISGHFFDTPAMVCFCLNILLITIFQNFIWDYVASKANFLKDEIDEITNRSFKVSCNTGLINAVIALIVSFFSPVAACIVLFMRFPMIVAAQRISK